MVLEDLVRATFISVKAEKMSFRETKHLKIYHQNFNTKKQHNLWGPTLAQPR